MHLIHLSVAEMELLTKTVAVLALIAILVLLITPAPDELPGLPHKHSSPKAVTLPQVQTPLSVSVTAGVVGHDQMPKSMSPMDTLSLSCTRLC